MISESIEEKERLFRRILRNRARRLLFRNKQLDMLDILGLLEDEEPCERRGGLYCMFGLPLGSCMLCSGLTGRTFNTTDLEVPLR